ncbi:MAG: ClpXP protease specificity-enhancing factor [Burkholderiales bacterium]|jgi:stringent starvation protein B|nr:ClpXP protease specificity-enhancing factor [Burkholderiales bacterium]
MTLPTAPTNAGTSTRPYLIRALHDWCTDNGFTPYVAVFVDAGVQVPNEYVKNNEIVLNIGFEATTALKLGNELIEFKARFGGTSREIIVPVDHVIAIYARENGQGMAFPVPTDVTAGMTPAPAPESASSSTSGASVGKGPKLALADRAKPTESGSDSDSAAGDAQTRDNTPPEPPEPPTGGRPALKRVK